MAISRWVEKQQLCSITRLVDHFKKRHEKARAQGCTSLCISFERVPRSEDDIELCAPLPASKEGLRAAVTDIFAQARAQGAGIDVSFRHK